MVCTSVWLSYVHLHDEWYMEEDTVLVGVFSTEKEAEDAGDEFASAFDKKFVQNHWSIEQVLGEKIEPEAVPFYDHIQSFYDAEGE